MPTENLPDIQNDLVNILLEIPALNDRQNRNTLLFRLPVNIVVPISRSNTSVTDLISIVNTLSAMGQLDTGEWPLMILMRNAQRFRLVSTPLGRRLESLLAEFELSFNIQHIEPVPEIVVGSDERLPIAFLNQALRAQKPVARLLVPRILNGQPSGSVTGTGWIIGPNLLLTNHHVVEARMSGEPPASTADMEAQAKATVAWFGYDHWDAGHTDYGCTELVQASKLLDYALLRFEEQSIAGSEHHLSEWQHLSIVKSQPQLVKGMRLNIVQHPRGEPKTLAIRDNFYVGQASTSDQPARIQYLTDTEPGASGSPVFDDQWQVIALHHASLRVPTSQYKGKVVKYNNQGIEIHAILDDLQPDVRAAISTFQG